MTNRDKIADLYHIFWSDFNTISRFADCYSLSVDKAKRIISTGRILWNRRVIRG